MGGKYCCLEKNYNLYGSKLWEIDRLKEIIIVVVR